MPNTITSFDSTLQLRAAYNQAVDALPEWHQKMLELNEVNRLSVPEIGHELGIGGARARVALLQARQALRQRLTAGVRSTWTPGLADYTEGLRASA